MSTQFKRRKTYTYFKALKVGDRFRTHPEAVGPYTKTGARKYESNATGDDVAMVNTFSRVRKLPKPGIEPN